MTIDLWNLPEKQDEIATEWLESNTPKWCDEISAMDVAAIVQGGCASGAYMPAVTYHVADKVMSNHGDDVLEYIEGVQGELPSVEGKGWSEMATVYLSTAIELFAMSAEDALNELLKYEDDE